MSGAVRFALGLGLAGVIAGVALWVGKDPVDADGTAGDGGAAALTAQGGAQPPVFTSSRQCKGCHAELYAEWEASHHAISYTNPEVRKLSDDFAQKECRTCHLPVPILVSGVGQRTIFRQERPDEGVDCLSCHLDPQGRIAGRHASDKGCMPVASADSVKVELCESCHNQHLTTDQWRASRFAKDGVTCNTCHMPEVERAGGRKGLDHRWLGAHDLATLKKGGELRVERKDDRLAVEFENVGCGHNFPTEERHRAVDIVWRVVAPDGLDKPGAELAFTRLYRFRQPYRGDPGPNTQLPAGETWKGEIPVPADGAGKVLQVRLLYKLTPFVEDDDASVLDERRFEL
ncbi:MAG: multiheme c-type cytochrome [Planctomycetota bacterium]